MEGIKEELLYVDSDEKETEEVVEEFDESTVLEEYEYDFPYQIRKRGRDYYEDGKVLRCIKADKHYKARVKGSRTEPYNVIVDAEDPYYIDYSCDCPYESPCKHIYATLIAISEKNYEIVELKDIIKEEKYNFMDIIKQIPGEELKTYLLSEEGKNKVIIETTCFEKAFRKYLPKQSFEYYYNNLYNEIKQNYDYDKKTKSYFAIINEYIKSYEYAESFKIIRSIIDAYKDSGILNYDDYTVEVLSKLGMYLRVIYRKSSFELKLEIDDFRKNLEENNYYDNVYLEDVIVTIKISGF